MWGMTLITGRMAFILAIFLLALSLFLKMDVEYRNSFGIVLN
jgi:hypothetical protein